MKEVLERLGRVGTLAVDEAVAVRRQAGAFTLRLRGAASRPLPTHVRLAIAEALEEHNARPPSRGLPGLREAIASTIAEECRVEVDPATDVVITYGALHALNICFKALFEPGDKVIIPSPAFFFAGPVELAGAQPIYVPCNESEAWRWNLEEIDSAVDSETRALLICNPSNPTGYLPSAEEISALVDLAERRDLLIVADESYERYVYGGATVASPLAVEGSSKRTIVIRSMSKSFAMPSWRIGHLVGPSSLVERCARVLEWECLRGNYVAQRAAEAAIRGPRDWLSDIVPEYERNRDTALAAVERMSGLSCVRPAACPFLFLNLMGIPGRAGIAAEDDLVEAGIPAIPGRYFQAPGYARLPFGGESTELEALGPALERWCRRVQV